VKASAFGVAAPESRNDAEILQQAVSRDRSGQRIEVGLAILLANIARRRGQLVEGDQLYGVGLSSHGWAP